MIKKLLLISSLLGINYDTGLGTPETVITYDVIEVSDPVVENPVAIVYIADGTVSEMQREEFEGLKIRWVSSNHPDWVVTTPTIHFKNPNNTSRWLAVTGFITRDRLESLTKPPSPRMSSGYQIGFDNREWTFPGDIRSHLLGGMHGFTAAELQGYSTRQLIQIHNYEHQNNRPRLRFRPKTVTKTRRTTTFCPT